MSKISRMYKALLSGGIKGHFGQWAEDVMVRKLFPKNKKDGVYVDLGSYHPFIHSNTAYLWMKGWHGINVDANPNTIRLFNKIRPNDQNICCALIPQEDIEKGISQIELCLPDQPDMKAGVSATGTIVGNVANRRRFKNKILVDAKSISQILTDGKLRHVDYLNIDIEGHDEIILREINFNQICPKVVSIEDYANNFYNLIDSNITKIMTGHGYDIVARMGPTSIFERKN